MSESVFCEPRDSDAFVFFHHLFFEFYLTLVCSKGVFMVMEKANVFCCFYSNTSYIFMEINEPFEIQVVI